MTTKTIHLLMGDEYPDLTAANADGSELEGDAYHDAWNAILAANEATGAGVDREGPRLDMEECGGVKAGREAVGIVIAELLNAGYTLVVREVERRYHEEPPDPAGDA